MVVVALISVIDPSRFAEGFLGEDLFGVFTVGSDHLFDEVDEFLSAGLVLRSDGERLAAVYTFRIFSMPRL